MDFLNWRNLVAVLLGAVVAGFIIAAYQLYENKKREEIAEKLYKVELLIRKGDTAKAEKLLKEVPQPSASYGYLLLGDYYAEKGNPERAIANYKNAERGLKERDKTLYFYTVEKVGYLLYKRGEYKKSLGVLSSIPSNTPNSCSVNLLIAEDYTALGQKDKAKPILENLATNCMDPDISYTAKYILATEF
jgi:tetratricopeptide (TPR) repeat protein